MQRCDAERCVGIRIKKGGAGAYCLILAREVTLGGGCQAGEIGSARDPYEEVDKAGGGGQIIRRAKAIWAD